MSPERKRCTIDEVRRRLGPDKISERRACKVLGQPRGTQRYSKRRAADEAKLLEEMRRIARKRPRLAALGFTMRLANEVGRSITSE